MPGKLDTTLAILNGLLGDHLDRTTNGLATEMDLRPSSSGSASLVIEREALRNRLPDAKPRVALFLHGLMSTESIWRMADGTDYGTRLGDAFGYTPLYVRYNTGLPIQRNGEDLNALLTRLVAAYPRPIEALVAVGHSMGGLILRSACHTAARLGGSTWLPLLRRAVYLGTPHLGSPLERAGRLVTQILRSVPDPYTRMVAEIAELRSEGIKDLGDGLRDARHPIPLLPEIEHYLVAAALSEDPRLATLFGDSFVPVGSATNGVVDPMGAALPPSHVKVLPGIGHVSLAHDPAVYDLVSTWLGGVP